MSWKQAGAELGQAQLKLELGLTLTNLHQIDKQNSPIVLCRGWPKVGQPGT